MVVLSDDSDHHHRHDLAAKQRLQSGLKLCFVHAAASNDYCSIDGRTGCHEILYKRSWFQEDGRYLTDDIRRLHTVIELLMHFYYKVNARTLILINDKMCARHQSKCTELTHTTNTQTRRKNEWANG